LGALDDCIAAVAAVLVVDVVDAVAESVGGGTLNFFGPPFVDVGVGLMLLRHVQHLTQVAPAVAREAIHLVVLVPVDVLGVQVVIAIQQVQVLGQVFGRVEIARVDVRIDRRVRVIIGATVHHRYNAVLQSRVQLVGHVIGTQRILEG